LYSLSWWLFFIISIFTLCIPYKFNLNLLAITRFFLCNFVLIWVYLHITYMIHVILIMVFKHGYFSPKFFTLSFHIMWHIPYSLPNGINGIYVWLIARKLHKHGVHSLILLDQYKLINMFSLDIVVSKKVNKVIQLTLIS
jgi:hypothetical protein